MFNSGASPRFQSTNVEKTKGEKKMKLSKNKTSASLIALFLVLTIAVAILEVPNASALDLPIYAYVTASPNPVGVGQQALVVAWLDRIPLLYPNSSHTVWEDFTVEITTPTGTETIGPVDSDPLGSTYFTYTPDTVGEYTFQMSFPGQTGIDGNYYKPATSNKFTLVVQEDEISGWNPTPLPTGYWERPIYGENREWYTIAGNWFGMPLTFGSGATSSGGFNAYSAAPETGHIVWTKEQAWGGIVGGDLGDIAYYTGLSYEGKFAPPIIMQGKLFYNVPKSNQGSSGGAVCVDLRTGEELWYKDITLSLGQIYNYESPNQHGAFPYLWRTGSTYIMYDPFTGNELLTLTSVLSGRTRMTTGPNGELLVYVLNAGASTLSLWNSSYAQYFYPGVTGSAAWQWRPPIGTTQNWTAGVQWTVSVPAVPSNTNFACIGDGVVVAAGTLDDNTIRVVGYDMTTGNQKWTEDIASNVAIRPNYFIVPAAEGMFIFFKQETREFYAYDLDTGNLVWGPTEPYENPWGMFTSSTNGLGASNPQIAYGTLYGVAYDGAIHAFDVTTGESLWEYSTGNPGLETAYGAYPLGSGTFAIADDKMYVCTGEHSPNSPMWRGGRMHAVDAHNGTGVWTLSGWWQNPAIADGYLVAFNNYDSRVYCIGKGPTATSVSIQDDVITYGDSVLVKGMVTDESPGAKQSAQTARFANGVPAIADKDMSSWMEYLYMQYPQPKDIDGVEVVISVLDPNNNFYEVGRTTSDVNGFYKMAFEPLVPGEYTVIASFEGSESYWSSHAVTGISVEEAPVATAEPTPTPAPMTDTYVLGLGIAAIIAIVAVGLVIILMLRKR